MSGKPRPRRDCDYCGRKQVAVMWDGSLWWHKWPGHGLWFDGGDCKGGKDVRVVLTSTTRDDRTVRL